MQLLHTRPPAKFLAEQAGQHGDDAIHEVHCSTGRQGAAVQRVSRKAVGGGDGGAWRERPQHIGDVLGYSK